MLCNLSEQQLEARLSFLERQMSTRGVRDHTQSSIHDYDTSKMCDICRSHWHVMMARFYVADALRIRRRD